MLKKEGVQEWIYNEVGKKKKKDEINNKNIYIYIISNF